MEPNIRLNTISYLLDTALDSEEEYIYEGEMSYYARTYAGDAADELQWLFRGRAPTEAEIDLCVKALSRPERMECGRSKEVLIRLRETSGPIIDALASSPDPHLRVFALETGNTSMNPYFPDPLYRTIDLNLRLLEDPDEDVRVAALATAQPIIVHNAIYLKNSLQRGDRTPPMLGFLSAILARVGDPSQRVQAEAANVLSGWADKVGEEVLQMFLEHENDPGASGYLPERELAVTCLRVEG